MTGTEYVKRTTSEPLRGKFLPIVQQATRKVQLAEKYNEYAGKGARFGLVRKEDANLDSYVTQKAPDGLFYMVAEVEKKTRHDPAKAGSDILRKVFGALEQAGEWPLSGRQIWQPSSACDRKPRTPDRQSALI